VLYPVAETAEAALNEPKGYAARERAAADLAGRGVVFITETVGPGFGDLEAALDAYAGRLDDDRPGRRVQVSPEARWCALRPVAPAAARRRRKTVEPVNRNGRRWPEPAASPPAQWRLSVSYWKIGGVAQVEPIADAARELRRRAAGEGLDPDALRTLVGQPLRAVRPQQPLDIGLFETRPPEAPHIIMPDE